MNPANHHITSDRSSDNGSDVRELSLEESEARPSPSTCPVMGSCDSGERFFNRRRTRPTTIGRLVLADDGSCSLVSRPALPPRQQCSEWLQNDGQHDDDSELESENDGAESVVDMVVSKRYESGGARTANDCCWRRVEAGTGVLMNASAGKEKAEGSALDDRDQSQRSAGSSVVPRPPPLRHGGNYVPPGAFRMRSAEHERENNGSDTESQSESEILEDNSTLLARMSRVFRAQAIVEARLVDEEKGSQRSLRLDALNDSTITANITSPSFDRSTSSGPLVEALPMDEPLTVRAFFKNRKVRCLICFLAIAFVILALGTAYGVRLSSASIDKDDDDNFLPTGPPTMVGDVDLQYFVQVGVPQHTRDAFRRENSPQSKALRWLQNNTLLESYDLPRRLQRFAMATVFFSTGGERRWANTSGWLSDDDECNWHQAADACAEGLVVSLTLEANNMKGTIPLETSLLSTLGSLNMRENLLTGFLPTTLGEMTLLREIDLFDNYLSGTIPQQLGFATSLESFDLEFNMLAQRVPESIGKLNNLKHLLLDRNALRGTIPSELGIGSRLGKFVLWGNSAGLAYSSCVAQRFESD